MIDPKPKTFPVRAAVLFAIAVVFCVVAYIKRDEAIKVWEKLKGGDPVFVAASVIVQVIYWFCFAAMYKSSYKVVGIVGRVRDLLPVWLASLFVNIAAPAAAPAVFLDDAARRGQSPARAAAGMLVLRLTDFGTLTVFIAAGVALMLPRTGATLAWWGHVAATIGLVGVTLVWSLPLFLAKFKPAALLWVLNRVARGVNGAFVLVKRPAPLNDDWANRQSEQFSLSANLALTDPRRLLAPIGVATVAHALDIVSLYFMLRAFGIDADITVCFAAFAVCLLYWIVSPTPDGVGFVEFAVAHTLTALHVAEPEQALAAALAFRGISLYLPVLIGGLCLPRLAAPVKNAPQTAI